MFAIISRRGGGLRDRKRDNVGVLVCAASAVKGPQPIWATKAKKVFRDLIMLVRVSKIQKQSMHSP